MYIKLIESQCHMSSRFQSSNPHHLASSSYYQQNTKPHRRRFTLHHTSRLIQRNTRSILDLHTKLRSSFLQQNLYFQFLSAGTYSLHNVFVSCMIYMLHFGLVLKIQFFFNWWRNFQLKGWVDLELTVCRLTSMTRNEVINYGLWQRGINGGGDLNICNGPRRGFMYQIRSRNDESMIHGAQPDHRRGLFVNADYSPTSIIRHHGSLGRRGKKILNYSVPRPAMRLFQFPITMDMCL